MDSVEGRKGGKVLLTIYFRNSSLMLAFIRDNNTAKSVTEIFDWLYEQLRHEVFTRACLKNKNCTNQMLHFPFS